MSTTGQGTVPELVAAGLPAIRLLEDQAEAAFIGAAKAPATLRAYRSDWDHFAGWCREHTLCPLPATPETVALYLTALAATHRPATMTRRLTAITKAHAIAGHPSPATMQQPAVSETIKGIRRTLGTAQQTKAPLVTADVRRMAEALPDNLAGRRDRALVLLEFAGWFRRSELAALDVEDVVPTDDGLVIKLRRSKTDPEGKGRDVGIPYGSTPSTCPVRALTAWTQTAGIAQGALFRGVDRHGRVGSVRLHKDSVGLVVKRAAEAAGLDPDKICGPFLAGGAGHLGVFEWSRRAGHHAPDRPPLARHGPPLHPRRVALPGKSRFETGAVILYNLIPIPWESAP
jgi:integrase